MPLPEALKFTYEDYLNIPDDGKRHEIIDGQHYVTPAPEIRHQIVIIQYNRNIERLPPNP